MEKHLFISYKHENNEFAENLFLRIEKEGFKTWIDNDQLYVGDDWRSEIDQAIRNSFALVIVMSPEAKASEYITYEWAFALGVGIKVLPILYKLTPLHPRLEALQYLDFTNHMSRPWNALFSSIRNAAHIFTPQYSEVWQERERKPRLGRFLFIITTFLNTWLSFPRENGIVIEMTYIEQAKLTAATTINQLNETLATIQSENPLDTKMEQEILDVIRSLRLLETKRFYLDGGQSLAEFYNLADEISTSMRNLIDEIRTRILNAEKEGK